MTTRLTEEEQQAIRYWFEEAGIPIIEADTKNKRVYIEKWDRVDFATTDFRTKLANGDYDNGIAIRTGKTLSGNGKNAAYSISLDFDGWDAVIEWFGSWEKVIELSKKTRIEWHGEDKSRIHVFLFADRSIANKRVHIKNAFLEIRCNNNLLFVHPSIHKSGKPYTPIEKTDIETLDSNQLLQLISKIDSISKGFMSENDKEAYEKWLDDPITILGEGQGRHDALKYKINSYYFKFKGEWLDLTDEQRFQRAWEWNLAHCNPVKPKTEFDRLVEWTIKTHKQARDARHKEQKQLPNCDNKEKEKEKEKHEYLAYKYSNRKKGELHEAVILAGKPVFLKYDSKTAEPIIKIENIEEDTRIIKPPHMENYPYDPYEFENMNEVISHLERAKKETIDSLYLRSKHIAQDYNDQNKYKVQLLATDIIWTYFQDRSPTTHYDIVLGSNGSGKSSIGDTFTATAYRAVNLTDPNAANINRILGTIEVGQCTIVSDETGEINKHQDLMAILKTGYSIKGKTSKINDYTRKAEFYSTYCFKMIIAERMPNLKDAKGVYDRSFSFTAFKGRSKYDIKETLEAQGNQARQQRLDTLNDFRKLMLLYRLLHFKDPIEDIDLGVEGREKELSKPIIQLFYRTAAQEEVQETLQYFLNQRNEKKDTSLEPVLHPIVARLVSASRTNEIYVRDIWEVIINGGLRGLYNSDKVNEFQSEDYGTIYLTRFIIY
jgi:hypothetical protein